MDQSTSFWSCNFSGLGSSPLSLVVAVLASLLFLFALFRRDSHAGKRIPRGSLGLPLLGESWSFVRAQRDDRGAEWIHRRVSKYGPVFKTSLMGRPTVVVTGQAGNRFVFAASDEVLSTKSPPSISRILGKQNIFEVSGDRFRRVKGAMMAFLKLESLQKNLGAMEEVVKVQLRKEVDGKTIIKAVPFMKKLTFDVACSLLFALHDEPTKEALFQDFILAFRGVLSVPLNIPGTVYWHALRARSRIVRRLLPVVRGRREELRKGTSGPDGDVVVSLLGLRDENGEPIGDDEVLDNMVALMIASHDTSATLLSLMVWKLARDHKVYEKVLEEQMEILRERQDAEHGTLTWNQVQKMKYTWRVAQELMRVIPPVLGTFREVLKDTTFGGFDIPKGWQVLWAATSTHMNEEIFEDAAKFDPSRFDQNASKSRPIPPFAYVPFGAGPRTCVGNEFARVETLTVIHHLVTGFNWSQVNPHEPITRNPMPYPSQGLPIRLEPRALSKFI